MMPGVTSSHLNKTLVEAPFTRLQPTSTYLVHTAQNYQPVAKIQQIIPTTKQELMSAAGIPTSDWAAVDYIVTSESGWNVEATNSLGAHGLPQALPYSKTGCGWDDGVCQLRWASSYATDTYGGWWGAYSWWQSHHWW